MLVGKALNNVHKLVFLVNEYPTKLVSEVVTMMQLQPLAINTAIWRAQDMGFFTINEDENKATIHKIPDEWDFGPDVNFLYHEIIYAFTRLARDEADLEENLFGHWTEGYPVHDVIIAMKQLLNDRVMAEYEINDVVVIKKATKSRKEVTQTNTYKFYTLFENLEMRWGQQQFKDKDVLK